MLTREAGADAAQPGATKRAGADAAQASADTAQPVEVEVDRLVTLLSVVLRPVLRLETPVLKLLTPVLSEDTPVLTDERPVLTLLRPVLTLLNPVEVEVDRLVTLLFGRAQASAQAGDARAQTDARARRCSAR